MQEDRQLPGHSDPQSAAPPPDRAIAALAARQHGVVARRQLDVEDIAIVDAVPVTTVARTLVDLAAIVPKDHLVKALREADRLQLLDIHAIEQARVRTRGRHGKGDRALKEALAELAALATTLTRSSLEVAFSALVARAGLSKPRTNAYIQGKEVDAYRPDHNLIVELDGWDSHHTRHAFQNDRERDAQLTVAGYRVLRFTHRHVVHDADRVTAILRALLASGARATMSGPCP